jgi:ABC-type amino acid transport substrate-binding protein
MSMFKAVSRAAVLVLALIGVAVPNATAQSSDSDSSVAAAKKRGRLIVGVKYDFPPFGFVDEKRQVVGFEVDIARELAANLLGNRDAVELVEVSGPNRIPFLVTGKVDLVIATLSITPERAKTISFSEPFYTGGYTIMVAKDRGDIKGLSDLSGKRVVMTRGSTAEPLLNKLNPAPQQVLKMEQISELFSVMQTGRADAAVQDIALLQPFVSKHPEYKLVGGLLNEEPWGVGIRKDDRDTIKWVNEALAQMRKEGKFDALLKKWGLS